MHKQSLEYVSKQILESSVISGAVGRGSRRHPRIYTTALTLSISSYPCMAGEFRTSSSVRKYTILTLLNTKNGDLSPRRRGSLPGPAQTEVLFCLRILARESLRSLKHFFPFSIQVTQESMSPYKKNELSSRQRFK